MSSLSHVVGVDDAPFPREHRGEVLVVGAVFAGLRLDGVLSARLRRDGDDAADVLASMIGGSRFVQQVQLVLLQGIALAGFNVVDIRLLHERLGVPVLVVARRPPDLGAIREALLGRVPGGAHKWELVVRAGPMQAIAGVHVQRAGLDLAEAGDVIGRLAVHGRVPEPIRVAHLIAGGVTRGESRGRA